MNKLVLDILKNKYSLTQERIFKVKYEKEYSIIKQWKFPENFTFSQKLYHYINNDKELLLGVCNCGKRCKYNNIVNGYENHCSFKCRSNDEKVLEKQKNTCLEKYGTIAPAQNEKVKEKTRETNLNRYGVEHPMQNNEVKKKLEKTNIERYGVTNPAKNEKVKEKTRETNLTRYGVTHPMKNDDIKKRLEKTNIERYGVTCSFLDKNVQVKRKTTNLKRYGVEEPFSCLEIKNKAKESILSHYGVEYPLQSNEIKKKTKSTNIKKYGVEYPFQSDEIKQKIKGTNINKYGIEHPQKTKLIKEKTKRTNIERYGVEYPQQSEVIKEKVKKANIEKYGVKTTLLREDVKEKIKKTNLERYGVEYPCMRPEARKYSNNSKPNIEFSKILEKYGVEYKREFPLGGYSYDFKIDTYLIEINPSITHNTHTNIYYRSPISFDYHLKKTDNANKSGYNCIHVWDWDDLDKIANLFISKNKIYARNCIIKEVSVKEVDVFLNKYHLQNTCKGQDVRIGLFYENNLVQVMTFGKPRYNKNYEWELLRMCSQPFYRIVGGAEKLFTYFKKEYNPKSVISYCDKSKFNGGVYLKLGFEQNKVSSPSKHWSKNDKHITDNLLRQRGFDQLFGTHYGKGTNNEELMLKYKYLPVYDCGQISFVWFGNDSTKRKDVMSNTNDVKRKYTEKKTGLF